MQTDPTVPSQASDGPREMWRMRINSATDVWIRQTLAIVAKSPSRYAKFKGILLEFPEINVKQAEKWISDTFYAPEGH